ncbi:MAG TPA: dephospho-CoA kinase, partial [Gemmatimonadaceae bacterium]|nr:dephospho-CoA kinase [Gemmatimonadaceae bacterium]
MTLVVGLTGNLASGKSTVAKMFAAHGATVIDADALAREAVMPGSPGVMAIGARWPNVILADGSLDRAALRHIVFGNADERRALEAIVHPEVGRLRDRALTAARARGDAVIVYDVPLLFEAGLEDTVDRIVLVEAPDHVRKARAMQSRGISAFEADAMLAAQMPSGEKRQ